MATARKLVELVDQAGRPIGSTTVVQAHTAPGQLHRAFSVMLFDSAGQAMLQRRALHKSRFAGLWTNTCCSHPAPGEDLVRSAILRLTEEMGLKVDSLREIGQFTYRAADEASGAVEHEFDHVLIGTCDNEPIIDESEVDSIGFVPLDQLRAAVLAEPQRYTPWLPGVLRLID